SLRSMVFSPTRFASRTPDEPHPADLRAGADGRWLAVSVVGACGSLGGTWPTEWASFCTGHSGIAARVGGKHAPPGAARALEAAAGPLHPGWVGIDGRHHPGAHRALPGGGRPGLGHSATRRACGNDWPT